MRITEQMLLDHLAGRVDWASIQHVFNAHTGPFYAPIGTMQLVCGRAGNGHEWVALRCVESWTSICGHMRPSDPMPDDGE